jgi:hypothetical protein
MLADAGMNRPVDRGKADRRVRRADGRDVHRADQQDQDQKKNEKELFFLDAANNMRICNYCPSCGRKYNEE